ncbi:glycosyltransferase [Halanaerobium praevalens]|uniref:Glycosyl transferase group 1 n=1 Tax=Halanaerobium praevalens (strain ATCC 33744 / DSM 2228 / GSL) TaxID=572479 RepID=E3DNF8_HALPG|nr:glycosyltransferase [Halanaerobium praevalens]ADO76496.1 glycosyl transferase group 1 [Halanaerobium praevalens DSM 2228]
MKVLQINKLYYPFTGGVEQVAYDISNELGKRVDMNVLVANDKFKKSRELINGANVTRSASIGRYFSMPVAPKFPLELKKINADIFHYHLPFPLGVVSDLMVNPNGKKIVTWHSDIVKQKNILKFYKPFLNKFLNKVDKIVTTSPNMIENSPFLQEYKNKCKVIPLGINPQDFELTNYIKGKKEEIKKTYKEPIIFFVGRLVYYKGIEVLIRAMENIDAQLLIGGTGPLEDELKNLVNSLDLNDNIEFLGFVKDKDLAAYYHASDFFVLPSVASSEAFGIVQLEAQACGKPVISTNLLTGVPYANKDQETGIVVEPNSIEELHKAIQRLLNDDSLRSNLGENAKKRVNEKFTIKKMGEAYFDLYNELLNQ